MAIPTVYIPQAESEISTFLIATLFFCFFISYAIYLLLPQKIEKHKRIFATVFIFIGVYGLFAILLKTIIRIMGA